GEEAERLHGYRRRPHRLDAGERHREQERRCRLGTVFRSAVGGRGAEGGGRRNQARAALGAFGPLLALIAACVFFATRSDRFLTGANLSIVLQQVMVVGVIAIGQTLVILTAGVDLSCGAVMALGGIVMTKFAAESGMPAPLAIACGIGVTTLFGLVNGA